MSRRREERRVVVVCESCETRFQLDESRIPPKGTLVRCSRCKATFIVKPPEAGFEETVQDIVAEVTEAGGTPVPPVVEDLFETTSGDLGSTLQSPEDDAWEFDEETEPEPEEEAPAFRAALPPEATSELEPFEAPEPSESPELGGRFQADEALEPTGPPEGFDALESDRQADVVDDPEPIGGHESFERTQATRGYESFERTQATLPGEPAGAPEAIRSHEPTAEPDRTGAPALDDLGHPDDWDLLGDSVDAAASGATFLDAEPAATNGIDSLESGVPDAFASELGLEPSESGFAREDRVAAELEADLGFDAEAPGDEATSLGSRLEGARRSLFAVGGASVRAAAWVAVFAALGFGARAVVPQGPQGLPLATHQELLPLADGEARGVRVRFVENAFAGMLYVVEGELVRLAAQPTLGLRVRWRDADGATIGDPQWAQPLPPDRELRERAPEAWEAAQSEGWVAPSRGRFAAIFTELPEGAAGVSLALEALPARSAADAASEASAADPEDPAAAEATNPSLPTAPPSTE